MAFFHGVKASEVPTSIVATVATDSGLPVVFGTAPVHLTEDPTAYVNKPVICYSWKEATQNLGYHPTGISTRSAKRCIPNLNCTM